MVQQHRVSWVGGVGWGGPDHYLDTPTRVEVELGCVNYTQSDTYSDLYQGLISRRFFFITFCIMHDATKTDQRPWTCEDKGTVLG